MNDRTLEYYDDHAERYVSETILADMSEVYRSFLLSVKKQGRILDLGCGSGRDSKYFMERGFQVTAVDGAENMCKLASRYLGQEVICKRFTEINYSNEFDGIWCCASLLHISKCEIQSVLEQLIAALKSGGILYLSFKYGTKEYMKDGRKFSDYNEQEMENIFNTISSAKIEKIFLTGDVRLGRENERWINVLVEKMEGNEK